MRRKKKFGVYSNGKINRCFCGAQYCKVCKGLCKSQYLNAKVDPESNWHLDDGRYLKFQSYGKGSLMPGRKFSIFCKFHNFTYAQKRCDFIMMKRNRRKGNKVLALEELEYFNMINGYDEISKSQRQRSNQN